MTLYLKYRPQTVAELDLTSVRETLSALLTKNKLPHAFLFAGPRGTGKTSAARILAKAINCENLTEGSIEPCNKCATCLSISAGNNIDVIEMDAASNRGIDEIRTLKQDIMLSPVSGKKKIYIIDEVHMLTTEASNALLKTLEEPPAHVIFILATTDPQKLPQTVVSRLSLVPFKKATNDELKKKLNVICKSEKIKVEEGVLDTIADYADGSFRDAVKMLEELAVKNDKITLDTVASHFYVGTSHANKLISKLKNEGLESTILLITDLSKSGADEKSLVTALINEVHGELLKSIGITYAPKPIIPKEEALFLLELLLEAKARLSLGGSNFLSLEIALIKFNDRFTQKSETPKKKEFEKTNAINFDETKWGAVLSGLREKNSSIEALLRASKPMGFDGQNFTLGVYFKFHKEKLETPLIKTILDDFLSANFNQKIKINFVLCDPPRKTTDNAQSLTTSAEPDIINAAKEIFG